MPRASELYRSLGTLAEPPTLETDRIVDLLDLGLPPTAADYTDLFESQLYPHASVYLDPTGMLGGEALDRIVGFWRALQIEPPDDPDHLTVMLAACARLEELAGDSEEVERRRWQLARDAFLFEHLLSWLPVFLDKLVDVATGSYLRWGELLREVLRQEIIPDEIRSALPLHLRASTALIDPRIEGGSAFLQSLLAPVRSGIIWVRSDLEKAASDLDLGFRIAERRFVLEALLAQDAPSTLRWMADRAEMSSRGHLSWLACTGPIARFWTSRARDCRDMLRELADSADDAWAGQGLEGPLPLP